MSLHTLPARNTTPSPEVEAAFHTGTQEAFRLAGYAIRDLAGPMPDGTEEERRHAQGYVWGLSLIVTAIESAAKGKAI